MKKWLDHWPFLGAVLLFFANVDWFVIPYLLSKSSSILIVFLVATPLANIEIRLWYDFWQWFIKKWLPTVNRVKEGIDVAQEVKKELRKRGVLEIVIDRVHGTFDKATNPNSYLWKVAKGLRHSGMIILGAEPFLPLGRMVAVIFCVSTSWKNGLYSLYIGNTIHVFLSVLQWKAGISLWNYVFN